MKIRKIPLDFGSFIRPFRSEDNASSKIVSSLLPGFYYGRLPHTYVFCPLRAAPLRSRSSEVL